MRCWWGSASPPAPPSAGSSMPSCPQSVPTTTSRGCAPRSSFLQSSVGDGSAVCQIGIDHRLAAVLSTSAAGSAKFEKFDPPEGREPSGYSTSRCPRRSPPARWLNSDLEMRTGLQQLFMEIMSMQSADAGRDELNCFKRNKGE